jgi:hypothetical protein
VDVVQQVGRAARCFVHLVEAEDAGRFEVAPCMAGGLGQREEQGVVTQLDDPVEVVGHLLQLRLAQPRLVAQVRQVCECLAERGGDGAGRVQRGCRGEGEGAGTAVAADRQRGRDGYVEVDPAVEHVDVVAVEGGSVEERAHPDEGADVDAGDRGAGVPAEQEGVAFDELEQPEQDGLLQAAAGRAPVGALEDEVVGLRADAVVGRAQGDEDGSVVAQRVPPHPRDAVVRGEPVEGRVEVVRR